MWFTDKVLVYQCTTNDKLQLKNRGMRMKKTDKYASVCDGNKPKLLVA